jgi:integrase
MRRKTYQRGSVVLKERANGPDVWTFRFTEGNMRRSIILGDTKQFPTKALAEKEADKHRGQVASLSRSLNIAEAIERYMIEDMPTRESTRRSCMSNLAHIRTRWGKVAAATMVRDLVEVEMWLNGLEKKTGGQLSKKTRQHVKAQLHVLFESIMRWGGLELQRNPIGLLRVKGRPMPTRQQTIVSVEQYHQILAIVPPHVGMMVQLAMYLGLRASEILGLRWEDIDLEKGILTVNRSVVGMHADMTKTVASNDDLPLHDSLVAALRMWRWQDEVLMTSGWLFCSPVTSRPYHRDSLQVRYLKPAGTQVGLPRLGWHSFRHTYRAMMRDLELPMEVQQRLMRHADIRTTSQYGGRKMNLKGHNAAVVEMITKEKMA